LHTQYNLSPLSLRGSITTIHDVSFFVGPEWFPPRDRLILQRGIPVSARRAKAIITVSETSKLEIQQFVRAATQKIHVTYNACPKWVKPVPRDEAKARLHDRYGIDAPFLLTVGTRWARKNMELAIEALDLLPEDFPHRLIITGKNGDGRIGRKGTAVGYVDQPTLCDLYSAATLYLAPSRHEGFGIPVLEAWRCGCPVLASSGGALPEVVSNPEAIMPSMNPQDWSNRIQELLRAPSNLQQMALLGAQRERTFSWKETAQRTISIYSRVQDELK
jgi:glycosyltransferase involved in cell wall biosynthesis